MNPQSYSNFKCSEIKAINEEIFDKNCRNTTNVQLYLTQLQVRCLLLNVQKNIGIVTSN